MRIRDGWRAMRRIGGIDEVVVVHSECDDDADDHDEDNDGVVRWTYI